MKTDDRLKRTMTVGQLIRRLEKFPPDRPVTFAHGAGDYWHTTVADAVLDLEERRVKWSGYHEQFTVRDDDDQGEGGDDLVVTLVARRR